MYTAVANNISSLVTSHKVLVLSPIAYLITSLSTYHQILTAYSIQILAMHLYSIPYNPNLAD